MAYGLILHRVSGKKRKRKKKPPFHIGSKSGNDLCVYECLEKPGLVSKLQGFVYADGGESSVDVAVTAP